MKVFKFGGASVKDGASVRNMTSIVRAEREPLVVVISAMGKMTNAFEALLAAYYDQNQEEMQVHLHSIRAFHEAIITDLMEESKRQLSFYDHFRKLEERLAVEPSMHFDFEYDQIVSFGELFSTSIIADYWSSLHTSSEWCDVRTLLKTDDLYRDANVNWALTSELMKDKFRFESTKCYLTQGFLGGTLSNLSTTLGREGSDYTAAIIGHVMDAESVTIWKDVSGVLNADPRWFPEAVKLNELSYLEAVELSYYGAQVIHPKTLKPLQNKSIPLYVKSFLEPLGRGTVIHHFSGISENVPVYILKRNQVLITISPHDYSFIMEERLPEVIHLLLSHRVKINMMQSSALNLTVCVDVFREFEALLEKLRDSFTVRFNEGVELLTIRQYTDESVTQMLEKREVLASQETRRVARYVYR